MPPDAVDEWQSFLHGRLVILVPSGDSPPPQSRRSGRSTPKAAAAHEPSVSTPAFAPDAPTDFAAATAAATHATGSSATAAIAPTLSASTTFAKAPSLVTTSGTAS